MMKRLLFSLASLVAFLIIFSNLVPEKDPLKKGIVISKEKQPKPEFPGEAAAYWENRLKTPKGENPASLNLLAKRVIEQKRAKSAASLPPFSIESYGPGNFGGRVRSVLIHPQSPDTMLTAGVSGGVWRSEDGGNTWDPQADFLSNIAISSMVASPDQPNTVYLGTGEGFFGWGMARGFGIFKSTDFGKTWAHLPSTEGNDFYYVNRLVVQPGTGAVVAATRTGLFRSTDQGGSWEKVSTGPIAGRGYVDLKIDPSQPQVILASHYGQTSGSSVETSFVQVHSPADIAGDMIAALAAFGPSIASSGPVTGDLVLFEDQGGTSSLACDAAANAAQLSGKIVLLDRGGCTFVIKVKNAQNAGAIGVIVANNVSEGVSSMGGTDPSITIPSLMVSQADGASLKAALSQGVNLSLISEISSGGDRFLARSEDGGQTFVALSSADGLPGEDISRMEIGWGTDGVVYVAVSNEATETLGLWKSTDHGLSFQRTTSNAAFIPRQGWYDMMVGVDPSDSNRVYLGAVDVWRSTDGGSSIEQITTWAPGPGEIPHYVHADIHVIAFHPSKPKTLWIGCDGGIYKTEDGGDTFEQLNNDLRIAQNYGLAIHPDGTRVITGTQDNGSHLFFGERNIWLEWAGGDGGYCAWDQQEPGYIYGSNPQGGMFGSSNMGSTREQIRLPNTTGALFIQPFALDPNNGNRMIVGTDNIYFTSDARKLGGATWTDVSGTIGSIYSLAFDPHQSETAYASNTNGQLYKSTELSTGTSFDMIKDFTGAVTSIVIDSFDTTGDTLYVTLSSYLPDRVVKSSDGGTTWESIAGDLPHIPVHCITNDPLVPGRLFIGTELGLFVGHPDGDSYSWSQYDYGLAWTRLTNLGWANDHELWAATYGRGTYKLNRNPLKMNVTSNAINGDGDRFLDAGETHLVTVDLKNLTTQNLSQVTLHFDNPQVEGITVLADQTSLDLDALGTGTLGMTVHLNKVYDAPLDLGITGEVEVDGHRFPFEAQMVLCANPDIQEGTFQYGAETMLPMTTQVEIGDSAWSIDSSTFHSGDGALYAQEDAFYSLKTVTGPELELLPGGSQLSFWMFYTLEGDSQQRWDGMVLEAQSNGGEWFDIGHLATGAPYDGQLFNNNALFLRNAWSAIQTQWRQAVVDLTDYAGQKLRFRFRLGSDTSAANTGGGVWIDELEMSQSRWEGEPTSDTAICSSCSAAPTSLPFVTILPFMNSDEFADTRVSIINAWSEQLVSLELVGFDSEGMPLATSSYELPAEGALVTTLAEAFPAAFSRVSWVQIGASHAVETLADLVGEETRSAYLGTVPQAQSLFVPHIAKQITQFETNLVAVNGSEERSALNFVDGAGGSFEISDPFTGWQQSHVLARNLLGDQVSNTDWGKLQTTLAHTSAMEFFTNTGNLSRMASLGLTQESGKTLRFLHIASDTQLFWTGMVYFNSSSQSLTAEETYFNSQGEVLSSGSVNLVAGEKRTILFDHNTGSGQVPDGAAWMEVQADQNLVGYELFGSSSISENDFFAGLQGGYTQGQSLGFQVVLSSNSLWTGLVLINVGQETSDLTLEAFSESGELLETGTLQNLVSKSKTLLLANQVFSESTLAQAVWIRAKADKSQWDGFSLWGDHGTSTRKHLAGVKAAVR